MLRGFGTVQVTDAHTGLRWGEIAGLQWIRTYLDDDTPHIDIDPKFGALHEVRGRLELGPPKTPASVRTVHLPPFLADELRAHRERNPDARFVFTGINGGLHRRSNFRRRFWLPALAWDEKKGRSPLNQELHFHDLRHTHGTWLIEDRVPRIMRLVRLGRKRKDVDDIYSHVTDQMIEDTLQALQQRWEQDGGWTLAGKPRCGAKPGMTSSDRGMWFGSGHVVSRPCSQFAPKNQNGPPMKIGDRPSDQAKHTVELCSRYSNRDDLLEPLVSVLEQINQGLPDSEPEDQLVSADGATPTSWRVADRLSPTDLAALIAAYRARLPIPHKLSERSHNS